MDYSRIVEIINTGEFIRILFDFYDDGQRERGCTKIMGLVKIDQESFQNPHILKMSRDANPTIWETSWNTLFCYYLSLDIALKNNLSSIAEVETSPIYIKNAPQTPKDAERRIYLILDNDCILSVGSILFLKDFNKRLPSYKKEHVHYSPYKDPSIAQELDEERHKVPFVEQELDEERQKVPKPVQSERKIPSPGQICSNCQCTDYPNCCFGEDPCDTCINGADGLHKVLPKRYHNYKKCYYCGNIQDFSVFGEGGKSEEDLCGKTINIVGYPTENEESYSMNEILLDLCGTCLVEVKKLLLPRECNDDGCFNVTLEWARYHHGRLDKKELIWRKRRHCAEEFIRQQESKEAKDNVNNNAHESGTEEPNKKQKTSLNLEKTK
jgi:hypothetical protein